MDNRAPLDLNAIAVFRGVAEAGSFTAAARILAMPKSTVSARIAQLEASLGTTLLRRTTRRLTLTDEGQRYFSAAARALAELDTAAQSLADTSDEPRGLVRVTCSVGFGLGIVGDIVAEFLRAYPSIEVDLQLGSRVVDLVAERFDVAIRAGKLTESGLRARRLDATTFRLYASPRYLHGRPPLRQPRDLAAHECLRPTFAADRGHHVALQSGARRVRIPVRGRFATNELNAIHKLALAGLGIALLPETLATDDVAQKRLVHLLPSWSGERAPVHVVTPAQPYVPKKVQLFIDFLVAAMAKRAV